MFSLCSSFRLTKSLLLGSPYFPGSPVKVPETTLVDQSQAHTNEARSGLIPNYIDGEYGEVGIPKGNTEAAAKRGKEKQSNQNKQYPLHRHPSWP